MNNTVQKINRVLKIVIAVYVSIMAVLVINFLWNCGIFEVADKVSGKEEIFIIVEENHKSLIDYIQTGNLEYANKINGVESVSANDNFVEFNCGGKGMGPETAYWGFYYSADGSFSATEGYNYPKGETLTPDGNGYLWKEPDGDNSFYVEEIMENFFYYESHY